MSSDGGAAWTSIDTFYSEGGCVFVYPDNDSLVFTAGDVGIDPRPFWVSVSRDSGENWERCQLTEGRGMPLCFAFGEMQWRRLYVAGSEGDSGVVFYTTDRGHTWERTPSAPPDPVIDLAIASIQDTVLFAATRGGLYRSIDNAATWQRVCDMPDLRTVAFLPGLEEQVYVGGPSGVWVSWDHGSHWQEFNDGLGCFDVTALAFTDSFPIVRLIAGTRGGSCWAQEWDLGVEGSGAAQVGPRRLLVSPNPVRAGQPIRLTLSAPGSASAVHRLPSVFDATGRLVAVLSTPNVPSAGYRLPALVPGAYFVRWADRSARVAVVR